MEAEPQSLRVLHLVREAAGGVRRHVLSLLVHRSPGVTVAVAGPPSWRETVLAAGGRYFPVSLGDGVLDTLHPRSLAAVRAAVAAFGPDVVHAHGVRAALLARLALRGCRPGRGSGASAGDGGRPWSAARCVPLVGTWHGPPAPARPGLGFLAALAGRFLPPPDLWVAVSEEAARPLRRGGVAVRVIPNGVEAAFFSPPARGEARRRLGLPPGPLVGWAGRVAPEKGPDLLVRTAALVAAAEPRCRFVLAGSGPAEGRLACLAAAAGLDGRLLRLGWVADMPSLYASLDVFLFPSRREGCPVAVLEAMAAGVPVVATPVAGSPLRDGGGLVVSPEPVLLARAVLALLGDPAARAALGRRGRAVAQGHAAANMVAAVEGAYRAVAAVQTVGTRPARDRGRVQGEAP